MSPKIGQKLEVLFLLLLKMNQTIYQLLLYYQY